VTLLQDAPQTSLDVPRTDTPAVDVPPGRRRFTVAAITGLVSAAFPYLWILWGGRLNPLRTYYPGQQFSNFYDIQARALIAGHWSVPTGTLGIEAFVVHGRSYTYFGPFPALLRVPLFLFTTRFDGRLTAPSMLLAWLVTGIFVSLLLWRVRVMVRGDVALGRAEAVSYGFVVAAAMGGTVLVYLASAPYVYNEDFAWGVALTVGAIFALLGVLERPSRRRVVLLGVMVLAANLSRTTLGWACVIGAVLVSVWFITGRGGDENRRWARPIVLCGLIPLAVSCYVTWAKFGIPFGLPMEAQVWTQVDAHRRHFLASNDGKAFSIHFIPTTVTAYLRPDGLRLTDVFPYITLPGAAPQAIGGAVLDQTYRTAGAPASMPLIFLLAVWGAVVSFMRRPPGKTALMRIPILAALAGTAGVFLWGYIADRYLADLFPVLVVAGAVGMADLWRRLGGRKRITRTVAAAVVSTLAVLCIVINVAVASTPGDVGAWQGTNVRHYVQLQESLSSVTGNPIRHHVVRGDHLPSSAPADELFVLGNCSALYISNGENIGPWIPVDFGPPLRKGFNIRFSRVAGHLTAVTLLTIGRDLTSTLSLQYQGHRMRLVYLDPLFPVIGNWMSLKLGTTYHLTANVDIPRQNLSVEINGQSVMSTTTSSGEMAVTSTVGATAVNRQVGTARITAEHIPKPSLCTALAK
jgi:hypothetical protein